MCFHSSVRTLRGAVLVQAVVCVICLVVTQTAVHGTTKDDIGYTDLATELGGSLPKGSGIAVSHVEAQNGSGDYRPDTSHSEFTTKSFDPKSGGSATPSSHATRVGRNFYGDTTSIGPDIGESTVDIDLWEATDWWGSGFLRLDSASGPLVESQDIQNHSWVGSAGSNAQDTQLLRRLDFAIDRDGFTAVVGQDNGSSSPLPNLLGQAYHVISVGRTSGSHSHGTTTIDGAGRIKPEIVVPENATSWATPIVGAAAAMVMEKANGTSGLGDAANPQAIKAILLAGATKTEFPEWDQTATRPLDDQFGAGELNIYRSYHILVDNLEEPASGSSTVATKGWDFNTTIAGNQEYFFDVPTGDKMTELSAVLTWHRSIPDGPWTGEGPAPTLTNIDLELSNATEFTPGTMIDQSISTVDNVEHIYLDSSGSLSAGRYVLEVISPSAGVDYSLAWHSVIIPEPSGLVLAAIGLFFLSFLGGRFRRSKARR